VDPWYTAGRLLRVPPVAELPEGTVVELPGRGSTYVVDTGGDRPPLVLLHALACTGLLTWYPSLAELRSRYRLVLFDQRWHGQGIRSPRFDLDELADDVLAVTDVLGIDRFCVAGFSLGSLVAQLAARRYPQRVAGMVLCASATHFARNEAVRQRIEALAARRAFAPGTPRSPRAGSWGWQQFRSTSAREVAHAARVIAAFDSRSWIGELDLPTAVVVTGRDRVIPPPRQRQLAARIRGALVYESDGGHASCVLGAERFTPALVAACASVTARAAARSLPQPEPR
jgi:pimeloyl-ACP methyl ester carboxylesterase